jgi:hypothetical protein
MSRAIANALPTCIGRTLGRVGFAAGPETFTLICKPRIFFYFGKATDFHSQRGIRRESEA